MTINKIIQKLFLSAILSVALMTLIGCHSSGASFLKNEASFYSAQDKAAMSIIRRPIPIGGSSAYILFLDGEELANIHDGALVRFPLKPGRHQIAFKYMTVNTEAITEFQIESGEHIYAIVSASITEEADSGGRLPGEAGYEEGWLQWSIDRISNDAAQKEIQKHEYVVISIP